MENKISKQKIITKWLLIVYLLVLTWIILFKMQFSMEKLDYIRSINLIPFNKSTITNSKIEFSEIYNNVLVFVPLGVYISMLKSKWSFLKKVVPILSLSLFYEVMQFILAIGASDITDIIGNTLGGIIGIIIYFVLHRLFKTDTKLNKILNIIAVLGTICVITLLLFLIIVNS